MRRNLSTYGMSFKERQEYRLARKAQIASEKDAKEVTISRLTATILAIEKAFKPEADKLYKSIVDSYISAYDFCLANGGFENKNSVRTAVVGVDLDALPKIDDYYVLPMYENRGFRTYTAGYLTWKTEKDRRDELKFRFNNSKKGIIFTHKLFTLELLMAFATKDADEILEANKAKLIDGVARYLRSYEQVQVASTNKVKAYAKGFQGEFKLITDKGNRLFTCKAITAEGPVVSFHWRYIIHVKEI